ncbi:putative amidohydrolase YtcJ [Colletotrichum orbiculare MAFF 240422]|uniref:Amidohydrolase YtcJ n=1 Tax=Colletotrichum orbiculare (strain 104-T / ATCC 96160 / CBS 514.97 / LARS 414 / MAFF 240422) TaxID=1213857 RepID=A0A484G838_COLOR|nr:putative amidohydrolase YtcJ [Colletotrichum orbiculare MAFF 240422]
MASTPILRWGLGLSAVVAVVALAVVRLQHPMTSTGIGASKTYCYQGIRTHDEDQPNAKCFSVSGGKFTRVFPWDDASLTIDAGFVIPGLWDGHGHLAQYGEFLYSADLFGAASLDDVRGRLRNYVDSHPDAGTKDEWIRGIGWDQSFYGRMPTAADIEEDEVLKGKYFMLDRIDVHCTKPGMGVFCDNAMDFITNIWPKPGPEKKRAFVAAAMAKLNEFGLVGIHDAGVFPDQLDLYADMAHTEDWTVRVYAMLECAQRNTFCPDDAARVFQEDDWFSVKSVKLFADGALGSWGSAMLEPYSDRPDTAGSLLVNASTLVQLGRSWASIGYQVNIHAIGDLANRLAVDALEAGLQDTCPDGDLAKCQSQRRFRIEHSQIIHEDDQRRIHAIGIIPSIQPTHATSDMKYAELRLGRERTQREAYRMRSLLDVNPILGSDFPVEPPNPFQGIYAAVTRKSPHTGYGVNGTTDGWHTEEALSLDEALLGFTKGPAFGAFMDGRAGVIKEGALADWVVLDEPLENLDLDDLRDLRVKETWVGGKQVYQRNGE